MSRRRYTAATLTTRGAAGLFATGAGFDAAGQMVQGGEYRPGQTLAAGSTALVYGPLAGRNPLQNAAVGGAAGGSLTSVNNWLYNDDDSVGQSAGLGVVTAGMGTWAGELIKREAGKDAISKAAETTISNLPSFISLPDANDKEGR